MARAQQIPYRIAVDDPQAWLGNVLRIRFEDVLRHREAALDPAGREGVHDMRVAVRRLRSVIRDFAEISEKFPLRYLRKTLKRLADSLGAVRDADVFMEALEKLSARTSDAHIHEGISEIINGYREKRVAAHADMERTLSDKFIEEMQARFSAALDA